MAAADALRRCPVIVQKPDEMREAERRAHHPQRLDMDWVFELRCGRATVDGCGPSTVWFQINPPINIYERKVYYNYLGCGDIQVELGVGVSRLGLGDDGGSGWKLEFWGSGLVVMRW